MAVFAVQAQETTATFTFKELYGLSTLPSIESKTVDGITISYAKNSAQNAPAYNKDGTLRLYYASNGEGGSATFTTDGSKKITGIIITAYSKSYTPTVKYRVDGGSLVTGTWSDATMTMSGIAATKTLTIQNANTANTQLRIKSIVLTYENITGEGDDVEDPETPVVEAPAAPTLPAACNFDDAMTVEITGIAEGATAYYLLNSETDWVEGTSVEITETTTVYAKVVKDELSSEVVSATYTKVDPNAKEVEATISFTSTAQRVSQDTEKQVWQNEGVTFTNNKANSSTNVANYSDPVRLYGGSNVVVEHEAMTKILFVVSESKYVSPLVNSISTTATTTTATDGSNVTVTFVNPVDDFTIASLTAQVRLNSLTITYLTTQKVVKTPVITPESCGFYAGDNVEVTITAEEGTIYYTTDGNDPTTSSEVYSDPFTVSETTTVKAIAVVDGTESEVATAVYTKGIEGTVTDAFDAYVDGERLPAAVTGYIVGYVNGSAVGDEGADCVFGAENVEKNTNILIADDPYETDYTKCLAVQLSNNEIRTALNLVDNPDNYQVKVVIKGSLEKYLNTAGLKDLDAGELYHTLTVSEAGWSTLYLGFNARIPSAVEAYTVTTVNNGWVTLTQVTGVLPSNQGVIIKAAAGNYNFYYETTATADVEGNLLAGSLVNKYIDEEAYVLANGEKGIGLYLAALNCDETGAEGTTHFMNNANKAYLPASAVANKAIAFYGFEWNGTTGVEGVEAEGAQDGAIYDITGRRVKAITAPGIYIVNGRKVVK